MNAQQSSYSKRNALLRKLGFSDYAEYLESALWRDLRERVFCAKGQQCSLCRGMASQVHHSGYDIRTLKGRSIKKLHPICGRCHSSIEIRADGSKRTMADVKKRFKRRRKAFASKQHGETPARRLLASAVDVCAAAERWGL